MRKTSLDKNPKLEIIFEGPDFLIVNKPANLLVHPVKIPNSQSACRTGRFPISKQYPKTLTNGHIQIHKQKTLIDLILEKYPQIKDVGDDLRLRPGIVHRLDKDVSGLMLVAKTPAAFAHFKNEFKNRRIEKEYLALVHGQPHKEKDIITTALIDNNQGKTTLAKSADLDRIKESWTEYEVITRIKTRIDADQGGPRRGLTRIETRINADRQKSANVFTLLKVKTLTGRTHQIRIHLKSIGHPIVGDEKYKIKRQKIINLGRIFLHAYKLGFYDLAGQWREFQIDLPRELKEFLDKLN